jgi:hypothetical protein
MKPIITNGIGDTRKKENNMKDPLLHKTTDDPGIITTPINVGGNKDNPVYHTQVEAQALL